MRPAGFYWLRRLESGSGPNPTVAFWSEHQDWQFIGSDFIVREDEDDDYGERVMKRYEVLGPALPPTENKSGK
jgi:hypothetical protein